MAMEAPQRRVDLQENFDSLYRDITVRETQKCKKKA
jgi:hypothetical protein